MIYIIITTCINNKFGVKNDTHRKNRYTECIKHLLKLIKNNDNLHPVIVENNGERKTYLNDINCDIVYTESNIKSNNKANNELSDIKTVINKYNIHDNDIIIKLTGRYKIINLNFINLILNNYSKKDVFIKFFNVCTKKFTMHKDDCVLGLFAIKCKYIKNFNYKNKNSAECEFANYIKKNIDDSKIFSVENLSLECCFAKDLRILIV